MIHDDIALLIADKVLLRGERQNSVCQIWVGVDAINKISKGREVQLPHVVSACSDDGCPAVPEKMIRGFKPIKWITNHGEAGNRSRQITIKIKDKSSRQMRLIAFVQARGDRCPACLWDVNK